MVVTTALVVVTPTLVVDAGWAVVAATVDGAVGETIIGLAVLSGIELAVKVLVVVVVVLVLVVLSVVVGSVDAPWHGFRHGDGLEHGSSQSFSTSSSQQDGLRKLLTINCKDSD